MKHLFLSSLLSLSATLLFGQGFASFSPEGALTETFIKGNKIGINGVIETIVNAQVDVANLPFKQKLYGGCSIAATTPLTADFSRPQIVKVDKKGAESKNWTLIIHQLKGQPLPLKLSFSKNNPCDSLASNPKPWAGYGIDYTKPTVARFGDSGVGFFVAFDGSAKAASFELTAVGKETFDGEIDVECSTDGSNWKKLTTYSASNPFENNKPTTLSLPSDARFLRWVYALRERTNVNLNNISIY